MRAVIWITHRMCICLNGSRRTSNNRVAQGFSSAYSHSYITGFSLWGERLNSLLRNPRLAAALRGRAALLAAKRRQTAAQGVRPWVRVGKDKAPKARKNAA